MGIIQDFRRGLKEGNKQQLIRDEARAIAKYPNGWVYLNVVGHKRMMAYLQRGWELVNQDPSDHGSWFRQYLIRLNPEIAKERMSP